MKLKNKSIPKQIFYLISVVLLQLMTVDTFPRQSVAISSELHWEAASYDVSETMQAGNVY